MTSAIPLERCPEVHRGDKISVVYSAAATYYAPSDPSGVGGMRREYIRATPSWRRGSSRFDCVFIKQLSTTVGTESFDVGRLQLLFDIQFGDLKYSCALIRHYELVGDSPDQDTGMWIVKPRMDDGGIAVISIDSILRAAHLIPVFKSRVPDGLMDHHALDVYEQFYVNKYADHHSFDMLF